MEIKGKIILYICALCNLSLYSQTILSDKLYLFNKENSPLISNNITSVLYDSFKKNYWIGCGWEFEGSDTIKGGLVRFNGADWEIFNSSNSPIINNSVTDLTMDALGRLLIANFGEGFLRYDGVNWEVFNSSNSPIPSDEVTCISTDLDNNIWIGIFGYGAIRFDGINWTLFDYNNSFVGIEDLNFIDVDSLGLLWFGTDYFGLYSYDGSNWDKQGEGPFEDSISITSFSIDTELNKWFTGNIHFVGSGVLGKLSEQGWFYYDSSFIGYSTRFSYNSLTIDSNDNKFIGSAIGLFKFDGSDWTLLSSDNSPVPYNIFTCGLVDENNNKVYGLRAAPPHPSGHAGLIFYNEDSVNIVTYVEDESYYVNNYILLQNYPNPFNPTTTISYSIPFQQHISLKVYDILGNEIAHLVNEEQVAGFHSFNFNARQMSSGVYFYKLQLRNNILTKKMTLLK